MRNRLVTLFFCPFLLFAQVKEISLNNNWKFRKVGDKEWLKATVPGTVHTDLLANKKIPDPFSALNEKDLQWIENENWEYETEILCSSNLYGRQNMELQFEGLDTYAKVYLNDSLILTADNMFRKWTVDVKRCLKFPVSKLRIVFESAVNREKELAKKISYTLPGGTRVFTRKAQYQYGWDFAPHFVTCGIWKEIKLVIWNEARLDNIQVIPHAITDTMAKLNFTVNINCKRKGKYQVVVSLAGKENKNNNSILNAAVAMGTNSFDLDYFLRSPQRWWCNGKGDPKLYHFSIELLKDGEVLDKREITTGLRKLQLVQEKDSAGQSFYFKLNGSPVFMKGANFIPPDVFLPRVKKEDYAQIVQDAVDANMNMLRVWGGGTYADDAFYDLCDEKGILVWQDFMFACAMYPGDSSFVKNVKEEVSEQVKRLRNHPCIALWCGNNEIDEGWNNWGWQKQFNYSKADSAKIWNDYDNLFQKVIPEIISKEDPQGAYWPSSPSIGWGHKESLLAGDSHYWGIWWGMEPFENYNKKVGRFMSEYGFQGMPSINCIKKFCPYKIKPGTEFYNSRQKHPKGSETIDTYMARDYKDPSNFEDLTYVSQLLQARGMQVAIEAHRRNKPYCMGSLYWQLNDCWPGITWSSIDFAGNWKAAHYTVKRCFENMTLSVIDDKDSIYVYVVSDLEKNYSTVELKAEMFDLTGKKIRQVELKKFSLNGNVSRKCSSLSKKIVSGLDTSSLFMKFTLLSVSGELALPKNYYFVKPKDLALENPIFKIKWLSENTFSISTDRLAKDVFLQSDGEKMNFSDNFFDLPAGENKLVVIKGGGGKKINVRVKSLVDVK